MACMLKIEVWFDLICPWCLIGKRNLDAALEVLHTRRPGVAVDLAWHSYPLMPDIPWDGVPYVEFCLRRLGSHRAVAQRQTQVREAARAAGVGIAFERMQVLPNTLAAHRLVAQAQREGGAAKAELAIQALFGAYFMQGQDIGSATVLRAVASRCGIVGDADASPLRWGPGGSEGVPFFRFNDAVTIEGAQPAAILIAAMEQACESTWP
jgi:predicted DsbA family dithiol-disulfide isomerase